MPARGQLLLHDATGQAPDEAEFAALGLPTGKESTARLAVRRDGVVAVADVAVRTVGMIDAIPALLAVPTAARYGLRRLPDSVRAWSVATRLAAGLVAAHQVAPVLAGGGDQVCGSWRALVDNDAETAAALAHLGAALPVAAHAVALGGDRVWSGPALLRAYADAVADTLIREGGPSPRPGRPVPGSCRGPRAGARRWPTTPTPAFRCETMRRSWSPASPDG